MPPSEAASDVEREQVEIRDGFVRSETVPVERVESWVHIGVDGDYHQRGGFWVPTGTTWGDASGQVESRDELSRDEIVQFPRDDREPETAGGRPAPEWAPDRVVTKERVADAGNIETESDA